MLKKIQLHLFIAFVCAGFFFGLGWHYRGVAFDSKTLREVKSVRAQDAGNLAHVLAEDRKIQSEIDSARDFTRAVLDRVSQTPLIGKDENVKVVYKTQTEYLLECEPDPHLSVGAVGLLNSARVGAVDQSAALSDEARAAASVTRLSSLVRSDIEMAGAYNELAARHNALVDYVEDLMESQARRLGTPIP